MNPQHAKPAKPKPAVEQIEAVEALIVGALHERRSGAVAADSAPDVLRMRASALRAWLHEDLQMAALLQRELDDVGAAALTAGERHTALADRRAELLTHAELRQREQQAPAALERLNVGLARYLAETEGRSPASRR